MNFETIIKYPVVFIAGLLAALLITPLWRTWAPSWGLVDLPGERKIHKRPIPVGGGVAIFIGFHVACAAIFLLPWKPFAGQISIDWWFRFIPLSLGVVVLGLVDDRFGMKPWVKLIGQILLAMGAYYFNIRIQNVLGLNLPEWVDFCGTILWFLAIMNALNLIDGVDGLATGISLIAAIGIGISLLFRNSPGDVLLLAGFAGACLGFLRFNFYPASVFLGDAGSLFVGFTLAALTISTSSKGTAIAAIGMPLLAVGVPLFDTVLAVWRRSIRRVLAADQPEGATIRVDQGDADHLHHRLLRTGRPQGQVAWLLYGATALLALVGILMTIFRDYTLGILSFAFVVAVYTIFRHLAWIELHDTGEVVLRGISKPVHRNRSLIFYILADILILNLAWVVSVLLLDLQDGIIDVQLKSSWLRSAPMDVGIPFLILFGFRSYSRTWSLAGITEYVTVGLAALIGGAIACSIGLFQTEDQWVTLLHYVVMFGLATPAIVGVRASLRAVQDVMNRPWGPPSQEKGCTRVLLGGTGACLTLYFRRRAMEFSKTSQSVIIGVLSDDEALRGHFINGFRVLGTQLDLSDILRENELDELIWVGEIDPQEMRKITDQLQGTKVRMTHWMVVEQEVDLQPIETVDSHG